MGFAPNTQSTWHANKDVTIYKNAYRFPDPHRLATSTMERINCNTGAMNIPVVCALLSALQRTIVADERQVELIDLSQQ